MDEKMNEKMDEKMDEKMTADKWTLTISQD